MNILSPCLSSQMSPRKHVNGASEEINTTKKLGIADPLSNEYNFCLNREDEDTNFSICHSVPEAKFYSEPDDYYGMVGFDETDHLYQLYRDHPNKGPDEYNPFTAQMLEEIKDVSLEPGKQVDDYETSLYEIDHSTGIENLDFENNGLLWLPPNAEDEEDSKEHSVFYDDDEEDSAADWGFPCSPSSSSSKDLHPRDKSNQEHKEVMKDVVGDHFRSLILQLLKVENLHTEEENAKESWLEIITSLSWEVAALLKPDTSKDGGMDPGAYVKVKCLACGHKSDSMLVKGVVCKKNVAHRRMMSKIDKPKILILGGALEYQRVTSHLSSVDTLLRQEMDHLKKAVAKIDAHQPNILLVENSVSRYAQEYLLAKNISLVLKIKRRLLERIARCSGADIIPSVENLVSPRLGHCDLFYVEKCFEEHGSAGQGGKKLTKNLMFFRDCPKPLGYTILLKGAHGDELKKVKHVVQYGVFAAYHLALETSFLADEGASLPSFPIKPHTVPLPDKPLHVKTPILMNSFTPSTESPHNNNTSEVQKYGSDPSSYLTSPSVMSPSQCIKHPSNINQSVVALLSSIQQFSDSYHNDQFTNYDLDPEYERDASFTPSGNVTPNFLYTSENLEEHVYCKDSSYGPLNNNSLSVSPSISYEETELVANGSTQLLREGVLPSPSEQQSILVSLATRCVWKGVVCEKAHFLRIKYYGSFDKPLGRFLQNDLFDQHYYCRTCEQPSEAHIYCYTHQQGSLTISVTKLVELILPGEKEGKIWMWHRCLRCPRINGFPPSTQRVAMSDAAWGFSFGKFLELSFSNHPVACRVSSCGHSIHRDCLRFYGSGRMVACFRYAPINVYSVHLPPAKIEFNYEKQEWINKEGTEVKNKVSLLFNEVNKALKQIMDEAQAGVQDGSIEAQELKRHREELEMALAREREEFEESLKRALNRELKVGEPVIDVLELNRLRRQLLFQSYVWDQRLLHVVSLHNSVSKGGIPSKSVPRSPSYVDASKKNVAEASVVGSNGNQGGAIPPLERKHSESLKEANIDLEKSHAIAMNATLPDVLDFFGGAIQRSLSVGQSPLASDISDSLAAKLVGDKNDPVFLEKTAPKSPSHGKSATASFDHEKGDVEKLTSPRISFLSRSSDNVENSTSWLAVPFLNFYRTLSRSPSLNRRKLDSVKGYNPVYIMSFKELECQDGARLLLPVGVNDTTVAVYDDEPSSIITYSLLSPEYHSQIATDGDSTKKSLESAHSLPRLDLEMALDSPTEAPPEPLRIFLSAEESMMSLSRLRNSLVHDPMFYAKPMHTRVSFSDDGPLGKVSYSVVSYFARRFEALRQICCPSGVDFARSLSRCKKWGAQGGKSNVFFAKTPDDRFILKQVTKTELEAFIKFAPAYFKYLLESISTGSPTCLAKILGVYQVIKQPKGGKETKIDVLVMENILYRRGVSRLYDLKGSSRSRYNSDSSGENNVLLDQNLLESMSTSPIFVGNNAKRLLERAVWNDTAFLASVDVMDYSLLVGVDEEKHELVVGIIDFMRQYTWDKHLETWVKASGILGGPKNASPTVISPMQYKKRFRKAMTTYFIMVPDHWTPNLTAPTGSIFEICDQSSQR